jgi:hypothetical protein
MHPNQRYRRSGAVASEEAKLNRLKELKVPLKQTALGFATTQMARSVMNNLSIFDTLTKESLRSALGDITKGDEANVI